MEELLKKYIQEQRGDQYLKIIGYDIDGANCNVRLHIHGERESMTINIWDMVTFLALNYE